MLEAPSREAGEASATYQGFDSVTPGVTEGLDGEGGGCDEGWGLGLILGNFMMNPPRVYLVFRLAVQFSQDL